MATSGIKVNDELKKEFLEMKQKRTWALLGMGLSSDKKEVVQLPKLCEKMCTLEELREKLFAEEMKKECYCFVFEYNSKLVLIKWAPDTAPAGKKMIWASTFHTIKSSFEGVKTVEASDLDEISDDSLKNAKSG